MCLGFERVCFGVWKGVLGCVWGGGGVERCVRVLRVCVRVCFC